VFFAGLLGVALLTATAVHLREPVVPAGTAAAPFVTVAIAAPDRTVRAALGRIGSGAPVAARRTIVGRGVASQTRTRVRLPKMLPAYSGAPRTPHDVVHESNDRPIVRRAAAQPSSPYVASASSQPGPPRAPAPPASAHRAPAPAISFRSELATSLPVAMRTHPRNLVLDADATPEPPIGYDPRVTDVLPIEVGR
jgi:hypothetical protein